MGGQACIAYGAAEFSRDVDLAVLCSPGNLTRLRRALEESAKELELLRRAHVCRAARQ